MVYKKMEWKHSQHLSVIALSLSARQAVLTRRLLLSSIMTQSFTSVPALHFYKQIAKACITYINTIPDLTNWIFHETLPATGLLFTKLWSNIRLTNQLTRWNWQSLSCSRNSSTLMEIEHLLSWSKETAIGPALNQLNAVYIHPHTLFI
jgi:hypothetical protein